ncbi:MAG: tRNA lysidine(34) synthetase TilS, partial [Planctomycetota bacterium]
MAREHGSTLVRTVEATVQRHGLLDAGDRVVAAVSGGPDSMALLAAVLALRERLGLWVCVAHLNHGLRPAAADEARFVTDHARRLGLAPRVEEADVAAARRGGESIEAAARRVRYAFLERVATEVSASAVATGHTADDQVETIVEGLLRGGGLKALAGMPVQRPIARGSDVRVVRPLLTVRRREVLRLLDEGGVAYCTDESNVDTAFERNAVRHELLPLLRERLGQGLDDQLLSLAAVARELSVVVEGAAVEMLVVNGSEARLDVERLRAVPRLVRRAAFRRACEAVAGPGEVRRGALDGAEGLLRGGSGRQADLGRGVVARRRHGDVVVTRGRAAAPQAESVLPVPGRVEVPQVGVWVSAEPLAAVPARVPDAGPWEEVADLDKAGERLTVRTRRDGDRFEPLGLGGSKKLKDFLIDERVPRAERARTLLVEGRKGIVW